MTARSIVARMLRADRHSRTSRALPIGLGGAAAAAVTLLIAGGLLMRASSGDRASAASSPTQNAASAGRSASTPSQERKDGDWIAYSTAPADDQEARSNNA